MVLTQLHSKIHRPLRARKKELRVAIPKIRLADAAGGIHGAAFGDLDDHEDFVIDVGSGLCAFPQRRVAPAGSPGA